MPRGNRVSSRKRFFEQTIFEGEHVEAIEIERTSAPGNMSHDDANIIVRRHHNRRSSTRNVRQSLDNDGTSPVAKTSEKQVNVMNKRTVGGNSAKHEHGDIMQLDVRTNHHVEHVTEELQNLSSFGQTCYQRQKQGVIVDYKDFGDSSYQCIYCNAYYWRDEQNTRGVYTGCCLQSKGDRIEGVIEEENCESVTEKMKENKIYDIYNFKSRKYNYVGIKLVNHELQLLFNRFSTFVPINDSVPLPPRYGFHLLQFDEFTAQFDNQNVLADLYGCIKTITNEYQVYVTWKKKWEWVRDICLQNLRREKLKVSLWGEMAKNFDAKAIEQMPQPVFAVITSLKVAMHKYEFIASAGDHTCIVFNPDIDDKQQYKAGFSEVEDRVMIIKHEGSDQPNKENTKTVSQLYQLNPESQMSEAIYCKATIHRYATHNGWWYKGCSSPNCFKIFKESNDGFNIGCVTHATDFEPVPCYRVSMIIEDKSNEKTVTLMGRQAEQLFGCTCEELVNRMPLEAQQTLPKEIKNTIGQSHTFELKLNRYGELTVKRILPNQQTSRSATEQHPVMPTPQKNSERKRGIDAGAKTPKKRLERQLSGATSSTTRKY